MIKKRDDYLFDIRNLTDSQLKNLKSGIVGILEEMFSLKNLESIASVFIKDYKKIYKKKSYSEYITIKIPGTALLYYITNRSKNGFKYRNSKSQ